MKNKSFALIKLRSRKREKKPLNFIDKISCFAYPGYFEARKLVLRNERSVLYHCNCAHHWTHHKKIGDYFQLSIIMLLGDAIFFLKENGNSVFQH